MPVVWKMMESLVSTAANSVDTNVTAANHFIHVLLYYFMVLLNVALGIHCLVEQYMGKTIQCFRPENYINNQKAIDEWCWTKGNFWRNGTDDEIRTITDTNWLLKTYIYFFIKAFVFVIPHFVWKLKYQEWIISVTEGAESLLKSLQDLWVQYSRIAIKVYRKLDGECAESEETVQTTKQAIKRMTRDVVLLTKHHIAQNKHLYFFFVGRMAFDTLFIGWFLLVDVFLFLNCNHYDPTDYVCPLPKGGTVTCVVPMHQFLWHGLLLTFIASAVMGLMKLVFVGCMLAMFCRQNTRECILEQIPGTADTGLLCWRDTALRSTYKVISMYLMQSHNITKPLNFMAGLKEALDNYEEGGEDMDDEYLKDALIKKGGEHVYMSIMNAKGDGVDKGDTVDT